MLSNLLHLIRQNLSDLPTVVEEFKNSSLASCEGIGGRMNAGNTSWRKLVGLREVGFNEIWSLIGNPRNRYIFRLDVSLQRSRRSPVSLDTMTA